MKYLKLFEDYNKWDWNDHKYLYHYTSVTNSIKIIKNGFLNTQIISLTESPEYHDEYHGGIPTEVRFVFSKDLLKSKYNLESFNANEEEEENFVLGGGDIEDDFERQRVPNYGSEYEFRSYKPIDINYCGKVEYNFMIDFPDELSNICKERGIELGSFD